MGLTLKKYNETDFILSGTVTMDDGEQYSMEKYQGDWSYLVLDIYMLGVKDMKVYFPRHCDFLFQYLREDKIILSQSNIPYIFRELFNIGYFDSLGGTEIICGRKPHRYPDYMERNVEKYLVIDVDLYSYGVNCGIWITVPFEKVIEYKRELIDKIWLPEWFVKKYITYKKKGKEISENEKLDAIFRLLPKTNKYE